eukprot:1156393-Pelagomonas_calceolata.AAC.8
MADGPGWGSGEGIGCSCCWGRWGQQGTTGWEEQRAGPRREGKRGAAGCAPSAHATANPCWCAAQVTLTCMGLDAE